MNQVPSMMLRKILLFIIGCALPMFALANQTDLSALESVLRTRFPQLIVDRVSPGPFPGLYEIYTPEDLAYTNEHGDWIMLGQLLDASTQQNITARSWDAYQKIDYAKLPADSFFKIVRGKGTRQMTVFADPFCPYCQELEKTLAGMDDVTVRVYLYPLESIHPGATEASLRMWCTAEPGKAWVEWMLQEVDPVPKGECVADKVIRKNIALGDALRIRATPTLFMPDGSRVSGTLDRESLETLLNEKGRSVPAQKTPPPSIAR